MKLIKVAAAVLNQTPLDWIGNRRRIEQAIDDARRQRVSILCLPELCLTGYGCEDAFHAPSTSQMAAEALFELLPATRGMIVSLGLPLLHGGSLFNTACLAVDGRLQGFVAKQNLAGDGLHYEMRWFKAWPEDSHVLVDLPGGSFPLGDLVFQCGGVKIGFEICEDAWVAKRPGADLAARGVDILLNPSASHFAFDKYRVRQRFVLEGSRAFQVSYVYANLLGNEAGRVIYDGDAMIASAGELLALGPRFSFADWRLTTAVIDVDATRMQRARSPAFRPDVEEAGPRMVKSDFEFPPVELAPKQLARPAWESGPHCKEEEFARAEALGLFDYLRKSRSRGFVVSLSGGVDSAACSVLVALIARFALAELGREGFLRKLDYWPAIQVAADEREIVQRMLTCVYQATRNSSPVTLRAAQEVAAAVNAAMLAFDVDPLVEQYKAIITQAIGRPLTWERDDVALQNIQARVRSPGVWFLANLNNALLVSTSNRSEAAVGYATMDGDTSGGLSPIAGIDKAFLRRWMKWMEEAGPVGGEPIAALRLVNQQQPTAELRPLATGQTDEEDLMPYDVLDQIERAAIRDKLSPAECLRHLRSEAPAAGAPSEQLVAWIRKFFLLWRRNQWKRERYAPSFHLDDESLDPKTWCRFPILSGDLQREFEELDRLAAR